MILTLAAVVVAVIAMLLWPVLQQDVTNDDPIRLSLFPNSTLSLDPSTVFSDSYFEARTKFRLGAEQLLSKRKDATLHELRVHEENNISYYMDIATIPGSQPGLVIQSSGVHGVEGFAGSAIQSAAMKLLQEDAPHPTFIFVHAVNPYGMAHYRRFNEHNVDLNRNGLERFPSKEDFFNSDAYEKIDSFLNPSSIPNTVSLLWRGMWLLAQEGYPAMKSAIVAGQYHKPRGIFYGGSQVEPSFRLLGEWMKNLDRRMETVTWIDVHTGLGKFGRDTLMVDSNEEKSFRELDQWFPRGHHPHGGAESKAVAAGYQDVVGMVKQYFANVFASEQNPFIFTQEFGTVHSLLVARALIMENAAYHTLGPLERLEWAKRTTRPAFYPESKFWRKQVLLRGIEVLQQAVERSTQLSKHDVKQGSQF